MSTTRHFMEELFKLAFDTKAPPVLTSSYGKSTQGVVAKPLTLSTAKPVKVPAVKGMKGPGKSVPFSSGKTIGSKIDPARANTPPPPVRGGTNVQ